MKKFIYGYSKNGSKLTPFLIDTIGQKARKDVKNGKDVIYFDGTNMVYKGEVIAESNDISDLIKIGDMASSEKELGEVIIFINERRDDKVGNKNQMISIDKITKLYKMDSSRNYIKVYEKF